MRYCFFGLNPGAMTKYPAGIARALAKSDPDASFVFIVDDPSGLSGVAFPQRSEFRPREAPRANVIRGTIDAVAPDAFITTAQRIPDSAYVSAAKQAGVFTAMFQHGLYLPFMRRQPSLFLRKAWKTIAYVGYAAAMADLHGRSRRRYIREFSRVFVKGMPYSAAEIDHEALNVDLVLLNGEHWRRFHTEQYRYPSDSQVVVGYPDYDQLPAIEDQTRIEAVCYVAQTLVEHGRLSLREFQEFLMSLGTSVRDRRLIVKLHPASDVSLYAPLEVLENVEFSTERLPRATHYLGHYSTYLALVPFLSRNLFLWEFDGHPIPHVMRSAASVIGDSPSELSAFVASSGACDPTADTIAEWQHFFYRGSRTSFEEAAEVILAAM